MVSVEVFCKVVEMSGTLFSEKARLANTFFSAVHTNINDGYKSVRSPAAAGEERRGAEQDSLCARKEDMVPAEPQNQRAAPPALSTDEFKGRKDEE